MKEILTLKGKVKIPAAEIKEHTKEEYQVYSRAGTYAPRMKYFDLEEAASVANLMANKYPGQKFYVLKRIAGPYHVEKKKEVK